jgi:hypothetical protein
MRALVWEAITIGASKSVIKAMLDAILSRHRDAGLPSPLAGNMTYSQLFNCVGRLLGKQQKKNSPSPGRWSAMPSGYALQPLVSSGTR